MRIVLDTASLITALRSSQGAAAEILRLVLMQDDLVLLMDYKLGLEYRDVALRSEHLASSGRTRENVMSIVEALEEVAEPVRVVRRVRPLSTDPNDDMVLDVAINGNADAVVTNNTKHFAVAGKRFGISVLSPSELLMNRRKERKHGN